MGCPVAHSDGPAPEQNSDEIDRSQLVDIPQPPEHWIGGNLLDIDPSFANPSLWKFMELYGPIVKLNMGGRPQILIGSQELMNEVCDQVCQRSDAYSKEFIRAHLLIYSSLLL